MVKYREKLNVSFSKNESVEPWTIWSWNCWSSGIMLWS